MLPVQVVQPSSNNAAGASLHHKSLHKHLYSAPILLLKQKEVCLPLYSVPYCNLSRYNIRQGIDKERRAGLVILRPDALLILYVVCQRAVTSYKGNGAGFAKLLRTLGCRALLPSAVLL